MKISEIFYSLQGEGLLAGLPSVFVRLAGCPLRCRWCDTKYALDESSGKHQSVEEIIQTVRQWPCSHIVITGGEPMLDSKLNVRKELPELTRRLKAGGKHVTIETAGIIFIPDLQCDLMSISPKLSNSTPKGQEPAKVHENSRLDIAILQELIDNYEYQLKFVVDCKEDLPEIEQTIKQLTNINPTKVLLMPQAKTKEELLAKSPMVAELCKKTGFTFGQRIQILLWNNEKGT